MKRMAREDERRKFENERAVYQANEAMYKEKAEKDRITIEKLKQENAILLKKLRMYSA